MAVLQSVLKLSLMDGVTGPVRRVNAVLGNLRRQQMSAFAPLRSGMGQLLALGAGYVGVTEGIRGTVGAAVAFESAFADVRKVVNGSDEQLGNIRQSILDMSKELPIAADGIASIYAAAGQANIPIGELNKFSEMVAKVSTAWEVPVAETGQALAEIKNQLNLGVAEVGLFADALNHLSNNTAANAPRLLDYTKRVAANGEMFGFTAQETLAFGGAMISTGAQSEVAATSFRNMGRALTKGSQATKMQREAMKRLGLDSVKTAKSMQKDALGTTLEVIEKIQSLPEWERISIASALFGDEARALMPVINNSTELRRQLGLVGDQANYAGSAFREYIVRADTVGNVLQILRNKIADVFRGIGDRMLPGLKEAAIGVGQIIDTLGERASIFDRMSTAVQGFTQGLGMQGGIKDVIESLGDMLFGPADGGGAADQLGRIFNKFEGWGRSIRQLRDDLKENPLVKFLQEIAPYGFKLMLYGTGFAMMAGAIRKLGSALMFLSGASTGLAILKGVASVGGAVTGGTPKTGGAPKTSGKPGGVVPGNFALMMAAITAAGGYEFARQVKSGDTLYSQGKSMIPGPEDAGHFLFDRIGGALEKFFVDKGPDQFSSGAYLRDLQGTIPTLPAPRTGPEPITLDQIQSALRPQGTQDVRVTNPVPPDVNIAYSPTFNITGAANPEGLAQQTDAALGAIIKQRAEGSYGFGGPR